MLPETRKLFKYILQYPPNNWTVVDGNSVLSVPVRDAAITITITVQKRWSVTRTQGGIVSNCDTYTDKPESYHASSNLELYQWDKDHELVKQLASQAKNLGVGQYKKDVEYLVSGERKRASKKKVSFDDTNRHV